MFHVVRPSRWITHAHDDIETASIAADLLASMDDAGQDRPAGE